MHIKVVTNKSFENYIDLSMNKRMTLLERYRRKNEDRWDTLDLDDIAADVEVPTQGESNAAIRELDLADAIAVATNTEPKITDNGIRWLDLDDGKSVSKSDMQDRIRELDFDDNTKSTAQSGTDNKVRELDFDPKGGDVKQRKSNLGVIGQLDIDGADFSRVVANSDDLYAALANDNPKDLAAIVKKYANDITDDKRVSDIMLAQAINHNVACLRILCGQMKFTVSAKDKALGFISRQDVIERLNHFKAIATKLTGEGNTYGLVPNAIVSCTPETQDDCIETIEFLVSELGLPIEPMFVRGAMTLKCYELAKYLINMLDKPFELSLLTGPKGLLNRVKNREDIPATLVNKIVNKIIDDIGWPKLRYDVVGDIIIMCVNNKSKKNAVKLFNDATHNSTHRRDMITDYIEDESITTANKFAKMLQ